MNSSQIVLSFRQFADRRFFGSSLALRVLSGSLVMLVGSVLVSFINFGYNVAMARELGPAQFGHISAVATLLMLGSAISLSFQLVCAKLVAKNESQAGKTTIYRTLMKNAWLLGIVLGLILFFVRNPITRILRLPTPLLIVFLGIGIAFSVPLGVKRGGLQGLCAFRPLASNFILEALVKLAGSLLLVGLGYGVLGAVGAISASVFAAFTFSAVSFPSTTTDDKPEGLAMIPASFREGMQAIVFFVGQVVINNIDILLVKYFFAPEAAGIYAAAALLGRLLYFAAWSIVSAMFPLSAAAPPDEKPGSVLKTPILLVSAMSVIAIVVLTSMPRFILGFILGPSFVHAEPLLSYYAASTSLYSLSVVIIAYEMSRKIANTGWLQLVIGGLMVLGIGLFHETLLQVIWVQIVLMALLLLTVSIPFLLGLLQSWLQARPAAVMGTAESSMIKLRTVTADVAIGEFLRNEFYEAEYDVDRDRYEQIVLSPDYADSHENAIRRALLFRRRGHMWRELPKGTQWWRVELTPNDLSLIHVFPRAQWRKISNGSYCITDVVKRIQELGHRSGAGDHVMSKIQQMRDHLQSDQYSTSTVLLIGVDDGKPLTILEGNHRLSAALLSDPKLVSTRFKVICGFSPEMSKCCWYKTNLPNLFRYGKNRLLNIYDREADLRRLAHQSLPTVKRPIGNPVAADKLTETQS